MIKILLLVTSLTMWGCVSVKLNDGKGKQAEDINLTPPAKPFAAVNSESADRAWQSAKSGNIIAFTSECSSAHDSSLNALTSESLGALTNIAILKEEHLSYNSREGLLTKAAGKVDGIDVKLTLLVFKKNGCNYVLSLSGRTSGFEADAPIFKEFLDNFRAP